MSVKRIARIRRARHVIRFYSKKSKSTMVLESFLELWMACKLENDPTVKLFASQPESMNVEINNRNVRYTPDFLVLNTDGSAKYIEVHHDQFMSDEYRHKIKEFDRYTRFTTGVPIELYTKDGFNEIELVNFMLLAKHAACESTIQNREINFPACLTLGNLIDFIKPITSAPLSEAYYLLACGYYKFNTDKIITEDTELLWNQA